MLLNCQTGSITSGPTDILRYDKVKKLMHPTPRHPSIRLWDGCYARGEDGELGAIPEKKEEQARSLQKWRESK